MQKILLALLFSFAAISVQAQNLEEINDMVAKQEWDKAKAAIDKYLSNPKKANDANGWYFKGLIYNEIAKSDKFKHLAPDGRMEAFNAFKKTLELEPKNVRMGLEQHVRLFDIYNGYFDAGASAYNSKNYEEAMKQFKNALLVEEYVASNNFSYNNFSFPQFDTSLVQNIALSAYQANNKDEAAIWYQRIADKRIGGKDFLEVYQFLLDHYNKKGDMTNKAKILAIGRELYPENDYWCVVDLENVDEKDKPKLFAKYDEILSGDCKNAYSVSFNYAAEIYNYLYTGDNKPTNYAQLQNRLEEVLKNTISVRNTADANLLMAKHMYNMVYDLQDAMRAIKGTKPEDAKKRADLKAQMIAKADQMIPYAQSAYDIFDAKDTLKPVEKATFRSVAEYLSSAYELKGQKDKAEAYSKKRDSIQ